MGSGWLEDEGVREYLHCILSLPFELCTMSKYHLFKKEKKNPPSFDIPYAGLLTLNFLSSLLLSWHCIINI